MSLPRVEADTLVSLCAAVAGAGGLCVSYCACVYVHTHVPLCRHTLVCVYVCLYVCMCFPVSQVHRGRYLTGRGGLNSLSKVSFVFVKYEPLHWRDIDLVYHAKDGPFVSAAAKVYFLLVTSRCLVDRSSFCLLTCPKEKAQ